MRFHAGCNLVVWFQVLKDELLSTITVIDAPESAEKVLRSNYHAITGDSLLSVICMYIDAGKYHNAFALVVEFIDKIEECYYSRYDNKDTAGTLQIASLLADAYRGHDDIGLLKLNDSLSKLQALTSSDRKMTHLC